MHRRIVISIQGAVQGVGFRPFIYTLAHNLGLTGWVNNSAQGVHIEAEGDEGRLYLFVDRIVGEKPPHARIVHLDWSWAEVEGYTDFTIHNSDNGGAKSALILPDLATCPDCLHELFDPDNRRYRYPFTNCTHCGPRYTIIQALPYDRASTTMHHFEMCPACRAEYENPANRRFHAQPNACPDCGPQLALWDKAGNVMAIRDEALLRAAEAVRQGQIVACKGLGGFHLLVDARNQAAVQRLRDRKQRPHKPLATMFPSLAWIRSQCVVDLCEAQVLQSSAAPIVLLEVRDDRGLAPNLAPDNPYLGVMLPYTPLHALLLAELDFPVVATSGNLSDEPICTDEHEALKRLGAIADVFLVHNRPIARPVDDPVVQVIRGDVQILRCARGYAPLSLHLNNPMPSTLAVGGHLKNTIAVMHDQQMLISQHIGDLQTASTEQVFRQTITDLQGLYDMQPTQIIHDLHPDYRSTQYAKATDVEQHAVQHHIAHVLAGMMDNRLDGRVLGVAWDGTGYGLDGTIWGGEWLLVDDGRIERSAHLLPFTLPGGDSAVREPRRSALGVLYAVYGDEAFTMTDLHPVAAFNPSDRAVLQTMLKKGIQSPQTTSMGRLFDAVSSLLNLCQTSTFEGQAAMALQFTAMKSHIDDRYLFDFHAPVVDWRPLIRGVVDDLRHNVAPKDIAAMFHNTLIDMIMAVAQYSGVDRVLLTGGCFQNRLLCEGAIAALQNAGFTPYWHHRIPPNDGGIAAGQLAAAVYHLTERNKPACV